MHNLGKTFVRIFVAFFFLLGTVLARAEAAKAEEKVIVLESDIDGSEATWTLGPIDRTQSSHTSNTTLGLRELLLPAVFPPRAETKRHGFLRTLAPLAPEDLGPANYEFSISPNLAEVTMVFRHEKCPDWKIERRFVRNEALGLWTYSQTAPEDFGVLRFIDSETISLEGVVTWKICGERMNRRVDIWFRGGRERSAEIERSAKPEVRDAAGIQTAYHRACELARQAAWQKALRGCISSNPKEFYFELVEDRFLDTTQGMTEAFCKWKVSGECFDMRAPEGIKLKEYPPPYPPTPEELQEEERWRLQLGNDYEYPGEDGQETFRLGD